VPEPRRIILYTDEVHTPTDLRVGERIALIRGDGPREGELMDYAIVTASDEDGLSFRTLGEGDRA
jgi:hypothetical protein